MGTTLGIISIKGGVGKTTTVSNLGTVLAHEFGQKVLLVDANYSAPNLGLHLGIVEPEKTLHDVLNGRTPIEDAILKNDAGFDLIPAALTTLNVQPFKLKSKLEPLKEKYDLILLDSSPNLNEEVLSVMIAADKLLAVSTPDLPTLSCTMHAVKIAKERNTPITGIILNRTYNKTFELSIGDIEEATGIPVLAVIPNDIKILEALAHTTPASRYAPLRDACIEYCHLASALTGIEYHDPRLLSKIKSIIWRDVRKEHINRLIYKKGIIVNRINY